MSSPLPSSSSEQSPSAGASSTNQQAWVNWIDQLVEQRVALRLSEASSSASATAVVSTGTHTASNPATTLPSSSTAGRAHYPWQLLLQVQLVSGEPYHIFVLSLQSIARIRALPPQYKGCLLNFSRWHLSNVMYRVSTNCDK